MVFDKIKEILAEQLDADADEMTMDTNIARDLGADSLDVVELLMSIEDEFEVEIPDEEIEKDIDTAIMAINKTLPTYKQVKKTELRNTPFEKTTTRKIKRHLLQ